MLRQVLLPVYIIFQNHGSSQMFLNGLLITNDEN